MVNKKKLVSVLMAGVTLVSTAGFTSCSKIFNEEQTSYTQLKEDYKNGIINALSKIDTEVTYVELGDYYVIDENIYMYDAEKNTNTYIKTNTYTISKAVAISEGLYELIENKLEIQNSIRH